LIKIGEGMKRLMIFFFLMIPLLGIQAQTATSVVKWKNSVVEENGKKFIRMEADIQEGWHLYSQFLDGDGPVPTTFIFDENKNVTFIGKVKEEKAKSAYDANFDMTISYFEGKTVFTQEIKNNTKVSQKIFGQVEFMVCDDTMCYPPETVKISVDLK
jgi:thiol:disulfide interchange protein DsbD